MNFEKTILSLKEQSLRKVTKIITALVVAGIMTFGAGVEGFKAGGSFSSPDKYIEYVEKTGGSEVEAETMREKLIFLEKRYSSFIVDYLIQGDEIARKRIENPGSLTISGFDKLGIKNEDLRKLWSEKFYPAGVIENNVSSVEYLVDKEKNVSDYNIPGEKAAGGEDFSDAIYFYNVQTDINSVKELTTVIETLDWHFSHELGHTADWVSQNKLSPTERVNFLYAVTKAFENPGSHRDSLGYIDSINNPNKQKENYYKVREYWATLCEEYISFPDLAKDYLSRDELVIIKKWLQRGDDSFNPSSAEKQKKFFIKEIAEKTLK